MSNVVPRPWVLGIATSHNSAVCLLHGDEIVVAIQEERLLRKKRARTPGSRSSLAIRYCLDYAGISAADLAMVVLAATRSNKESTEDLTLNPLLEISRNRIPVMVMGHHLAHAVGAFATSGLRDAAVLVVDGCGSPWSDLSAEERSVVAPHQAAQYARQQRGPLTETISLYLADARTVRPVEKHVGSKDLRRKSGMPRYWSLGFMYESAASQIFGNGLDGAGKLMGLAPYGSPVIPTRDFYSMAGDQFEFLDTVPSRYLHDDRWPLRRDEYQNLAASTQRALEDALFVLAVRVRQLTGARRLCYTGGVALNSVANELLVNDGGFDEVFIMPAAEDSGTAIGAAYYGLWQLLGCTTHRALKHDAVGRRYTAADVQTAIDSCPAIHVAPSGDVIDQAVDMLCDGKILGWFSGRSELGPRALGQRSIVCDPRDANIKQVLNSRIKFREEFRPFAPVIPADQLSAWFETMNAAESPSMLRIMPFREEVRGVVPAVVHVDGTGRVQTVTREANGKFYDLIARFFQRTNCPILLNTSFNVAGEPIVETPDDALNCLLLTGLDACVLEDRLVTKSSTYGSPLDLVPQLAVDRVALNYRVAPGWTSTRPQSDVRIRFFRSGCLDRMANAEQRIVQSRDDVLRIVTWTRWGAVIHETNAGVIEILTRIDGLRNGWQVLDALRREVDGIINERDLTSVFAALRRVSIIKWDAIRTRTSTVHMVSTTQSSSGSM